MIEISRPDEEQRDRLAPQLAAWAYAAGVDYENWRFGDSAAAHVELERWVRRSSSELAARRWHVAFEEGQPIGGAASLMGHEVGTARRSDLMALMHAPGFAHRRERLALVRTLFEPVAPRELYLSRIAVTSGARSRGIGAALLDAVIDYARQQDATAVRLDVTANNLPALRLYERMGFVVFAENESEAAALRYRALRLPL